MQKFFFPKKINKSIEQSHLTLLTNIHVVIISRPFYAYHISMCA